MTATGYDKIVRRNSLRWTEFINGLKAAMTPPNPEGDYRCGNNLRQAETVLTAMGVDVAGTLAWCKDEGGTCDCQILYLVADVPAYQPPPRASSRG